jgi:hypothetical protein
MAQEVDWAKLDEDMLVMERLVRDTLREAVVDPEVRSLQEELKELEEVSESGEYSDAQGMAQLEKRLAETKAYLAAQKNAIALAYLDFELDTRTQQVRHLQAVLSSLGTRVSTDPAADSLYLPGYGAVFALRVQFPLSNGKEPSPTPSAEKERRWEDTRREVLGLPKLPTEARVTSSLYDEELVGRIKEAVSGLLATEAQNFRPFPGNERLTVFLHSAAKERTARTRTVRRGIPSVQPAEAVAEIPMPAPVDEMRNAESIFLQRVISNDYVFRSSRSSSSTPARTGLMLSVKGADLAAQREGKITEEELEKRIEIRQF